MSEDSHREGCCGAGDVPGLTPARVSLALHRLARSVTLDWSPVARARDIDLGFEHEADVDVLGQPDLLGEMIGNLIDNAIRYAGDRAVITVRVSRDGEHARLDVIDNGPGIPAGERDAVFERFHRGSKTQTVEGTGLGLSIVREIARVHQGSVTLADAVGGGLVVTILLPLAQADGRVPQEGA